MIKLNETKMEATPRPWRISGCRSHNVTTGVDELMIEHGTEDEFSPILASLQSHKSNKTQTKMTTLDTKNERLIAALFLAITATTQAKTDECVKLAEWLAVGMGEKSIEHCKLVASLAATRFNAERSAAQ